MWTRDLIAASARSAYDHHGEARPEGIARTAEAAAERLAADLGMDSDPGSVLAHLVDGSMIEARFDGGTRYRALETLRAFGLDRLAAASKDEAAARRMFGWAVELTAEIEAALTTEHEPEADATCAASWRPRCARGAYVAGEIAGPDGPSREHPLLPRVECCARRRTMLVLVRGSGSCRALTDRSDVFRELG